MQQGYLPGLGTRTRAEVTWQKEVSNTHSSSELFSRGGQKAGHVEADSRGGEGARRRLRERAGSEHAYQETHQAQEPSHKDIFFPESWTLPEGLSCRKDPGLHSSQTGPLPLLILPFIFPHISAYVYLPCM